MRLFPKSMADFVVDVSSPVVSAAWGVATTSIGAQTVPRVAVLADWLFQ